MKVFVYGTLKKGYGNNVLLRNAKFIEDRVIQGYELLYAGFPVAVPNETSSILGEVYEISDDDDFTLSRLDRLESEGSMYNRIEVDGCQMYVGNKSFWGSYSLRKCPKTEENVYYWE